MGVIRSAYGTATGHGSVSWDLRDDIFITRFTDGDFLVRDGVPRFVISVLVETVHVERRASKLEKLVDEVFRLCSCVLLQGLAKGPTANVTLSDHPQDQIEHIRHSVLVISQQNIELAVQPGN